MDSSQSAAIDRGNGPKPVGVTWAGGEVRLRDPRVFGLDVADSTLCARFLGRVLTLDEVLGIVVERDEGAAVIRLAPGSASGDNGAFLARLAAAIRGDGLSNSPGWSIPAARWERGTRFSVYRHGGIYSMWGIVYDRPGRLRLRHEALSLNPGLGHRLARMIASLAPGVSVSASAWTGSLAIDYNPARLTTSELIRLAEESLERASAEDPNAASGPRAGNHAAHAPVAGSRTTTELDRLAREPAPDLAADLVAAGATPEAAAIVAAAEASLAEGPTSAYGSDNIGLAGATLGIAALGQFAVPALVPVSAVLLVGTNLRTFGAAWRQARERRVGLPALSTTIVATTMASGQFVGSALMTCFTAYWNRRARRDLEGHRRHLLEECLPSPPLVRLLDGPEGAPEILVPPDQIREGNTIVVVAGEAVPADGKLLDGGLVVDERSLRGLDGASRKVAGDFVLAGSTVLAGSARVRVERAGESTRGAIIARALTSATSPARGRSAPTRHAETFATKAVTPVLATSGLGFLAMGDPVTALAMMRPDYATGVGISVPLATLRDVATCARRGIVIRDPEAFDKLDRVDAILLDDSPALRRTTLEVAGVETRMPSEVEPELLRYAASALRHLDDPRVPALASACRARGVHLFELEPAELADRGVGVAIVHGTRQVRVHEADASIESALLDDAGPREAPSDIDRGIRPLLVEINGNLVAIISFRPSSKLEGAEAIRRLAAMRRVPIVLMTDRPRADVASLAASLGVNQVRGDLTAQARAEFVRSYRLRGLKAAYVGDCSNHELAPAAAEAFIAISVPGGFSRAEPNSGRTAAEGKGKSRSKARGSHRPMSSATRGSASDPLHPVEGANLDESFLLTDPGPASVQLLGDRLDRLEVLWEVASERSRRIRRDQTIVTVPNVAAVAGALLFGFTSIHSIVLTNLGTYTAYNLAVGPRDRRGGLAGARRSQAIANS